MDTHTGLVFVAKLSSGGHGERSQAGFYFQDVHRVGTQVLPGTLEGKVCIIAITDSVTRGIWKNPAGREGSRLNVTRRLDRAMRGEGRGAREEERKSKEEGTKKGRQRQQRAGTAGCVGMRNWAKEAQGQRFRVEVERDKPRGAGAPAQAPKQAFPMLTAWRPACTLAH